MPPAVPSPWRVPARWRRGPRLNGRVREDRSSMWVAMKCGGGRGCHMSSVVRAAGLQVVPTRRECLCFVSFTHSELDHSLASPQVLPLPPLCQPQLIRSHGRSISGSLDGSYSSLSSVDDAFVSSEIMDIEQLKQIEVGMPDEIPRDHMPGS